MVVKTFRGLLAAEGQDRIRLSTIKGKVGYRIIKLELMTNTPGQTDHAEHVVKVFNKFQSTINGVVDFSASDLLAAGVTFNRTDASAYYPTNNVIFDGEIFNQDIYITHSEVIAGNAESCNYYLELEVIPLTDQGAEYTTLKDIRTQLTIS
jgi:hypothetical protein